MLNRLIVEGINDGLNDGLNDGINEGINDGLSGGLKEGINGAKKRHLRIVDLIKSNPAITLKELQSVLCVSESTLDRDIAILKKQNVVIRIGSKKSGHWEIVSGN